MLFKSCGYCENVNFNAQLVILIGIPNKVAKQKIEIYPLIAEAIVRKCSI